MPFDPARRYCSLPVSVAAAKPGRKLRSFPAATRSGVITIGSHPGRGSAGRRTTLRFSILGPLEIIDDAGWPVTVSRPLHRAALSLLLLNAGQPCSAASLIAALWGDEPPLRPKTSLRSCIYGMRKVLPDAGRIKTQPSGYLITVGPSELDLDDFGDLAGRGREALDAGNPVTAAALLRQAVALWREPALADLPPGAAKQRLLDQRNEVQEALTDAR